MLLLTLTLHMYTSVIHTAAMLSLSPTTGRGHIQPLGSPLFLPQQYPSFSLLVPVTFIWEMVFSSPTSSLSCTNPYSWAHTLSLSGSDKFRKDQRYYKLLLLGEASYDNCSYILWWRGWYKASCMHHKLSQY